MTDVEKIVVSPVMQIIRFSLLLLNAVFWISGLCLFVIGIWALVELRKYDDISHPNNYNAVAILLIIIGLVIACVGFCGCCGALKKNVCLLKMFAIFLGIIILCEVCVAVSGYAYKKKIKSALSSGLTETMKDYKKPGLVRNTWDKMQENFDCCGNKNYSDWFKVRWNEKQVNNSTNKTVPLSCCKHQKIGCNMHFQNASDPAKKWIYTKGCYNSITDFFQSKFYVLASGALGVAIIQIIAVACAGCFATHIQRKTKYELV